MVPIAGERERREESKKGDIGKSLNLETLAEHLTRIKAGHQIYPNKEPDQAR
jgi:hypothetical protein